MVRVAAGWALSSFIGVCHLLAAQGDSAQKVAAPIPAPRGMLSLELSDAKLSAALFAAAVDRTPENLEAIAVRYQQVGVLDKALDYYAQSLSSNPKGVTALDGTARIWRDWGEMGPALGSAYRAVHYSPSSAAAWNTLGTILQDVGDHRAARKAYLKARTLDPSASYVATNMCYLAFVQGNVDGAFAECAMAVALDGSSASALNNLALVYAATGNRRLAEETFMRAGNQAAGHYNAGIVLMAERNYAAAAIAFERAARRKPGFYAALTMAAFARKRARAGGEGN